MKKAIRIRVTGKVQNVGFRFYTVKMAQQTGISGFVRNESDGSVYIEAEGDPVDLATFTDWCRRGPQWARVTNLESQDTPVTGYDSFMVK